MFGSCGHRCILNTSIPEHSCIPQSPKNVWGSEDRVTLVAAKPDINANTYILCVPCFPHLWAPRPFGIQGRRIYGWPQLPDMFANTHILCVPCVPHPESQNLHHSHLRCSRGNSCIISKKNSISLCNTRAFGHKRERGAGGGGSILSGPTQRWEGLLFDDLMTVPLPVCMRVYLRTACI